MAIKTQYDTLDEIPEQYRDLFKEVDGKYVLTEVIGMKSQADIDRLQESLRKERSDHKAVKDKYAFLSDIEPDKLQEMIDRFPELEAAAGGNSAEAVQKQVDAKLAAIKAPLERQIAKLQNELGETQTAVNQYKERETERKIVDAVTTAARKLKVQDCAIEDAILTGRSHLMVDEDGNVVTRDGAPISAGLNAEVWLTEMQSKRAHWWGDSTGGGAGGSKGGNAGANNPWSKENWNMTQQGQVYRENPQKAEQMAKAAGVTIGAIGPKG